MQNGNWTHENTNRLRVLWALGLPGSKIAADLGPLFTRSAVLGKAHRLQLAPRAVDERSPVMSTTERRERDALRKRAAMHSPITIIHVG